MFHNQVYSARSVHQRLFDFAVAPHNVVPVSLVLAPSPAVVVEDMQILEHVRRCGVVVAVVVEDVVADVQIGSRVTLTHNANVNLGLFSGSIGTVGPTVFPERGVSQEVHLYTYIHRYTSKEIPLGTSW